MHGLFSAPPLIQMNWTRIPHIPSIITVATIPATTAPLTMNPPGPRKRRSFCPLAREGQCLPAWVRRAAHWQGRAASAVCKKGVAASSRIELADTGQLIVI
jgi:hypothetical protein